MGGAWTGGACRRREQDTNDDADPEPGPRRGAYAITIIRGTWYAWRNDGSKAVTAGSPEGLWSAITVDRESWIRPRIPLSARAAA